MSLNLSLLQRVKVYGRKGEFLVCRIDSEFECVDLVPWGAEYTLHTDVTFAVLETAEHDREAA